MIDLKILKAKPEDVEWIYQVRKITWLDTYPNEDFGITKKDIEEKFIEMEKDFKKYLEERKEVIAYAKRLDLLFTKTKSKRNIVISWIPKKNTRYVPL